MEGFSRSFLQSCPNFPWFRTCGHVLACTHDGLRICPISLHNLRNCASLVPSRNDALRQNGIGLVRPLVPDHCKPLKRIMACAVFCFNNFVSSADNSCTMIPHFQHKTFLIIVSVARIALSRCAKNVSRHVVSRHGKKEVTNPTRKNVITAAMWRRCVFLFSWKISSWLSFSTTENGRRTVTSSPPRVFAHDANRVFANTLQTCENLFLTSFSVPCCSPVPCHSDPYLAL